MNDKTYVVKHYTLEQAKKLLDNMDTCYDAGMEWRIGTFLNELYDKGYEICRTTEEKNARRHTEN